MKERPPKLSVVGNNRLVQVPIKPIERDKIRLPDFIRENAEQIVSEWESFARSLAPNPADASSYALRDHIYQMLSFIIKDIDSPQTRSEQLEKSLGKKERSATRTAAETHAALRLAGGFDIDQMVSEFRALRASVIKLWSTANKQIIREDIIDLTRFSEAIDQTLGESVSYYTKEANHAKHLFLGILGHDLRTPLGVVGMSAELLAKLGPLNERQTMLATQIGDSTSRAIQIVSDLVDVTRARFGSGLPINRAFMDMGFVSHQLVDEMRAAYPSRTINLDVSGDMLGEWDKARIGQVFSNLIGNAIQYSFADTSINVSVAGYPDRIGLSVHNEGNPIPAAKIVMIFDPLSRAVADESNEAEARNLGLGLYITKDIVISHGGRIDVTSSEESGTNFTAQFPRQL
jgi:signal transduction histidine kinase